MNNILLFFFFFISFQVFVPNDLDIVRFSGPTIRSNTVQEFTDFSLFSQQRKRILFVFLFVFYSPFVNLQLYSLPRFFSISGLERFLLTCSEAKANTANDQNNCHDRYYAWREHLRIQIQWRVLAHVSRISINPCVSR